MLARGIAWWEGIGAWVLLPALSLLVAGDVMLRYFLNLPLQWGSDVKGLLLILVMVAGLGGTSLHDQHIRVVLFDSHLPAGLRRAVARLRHLLTAVVAAVVTWAVADLALDLYRFGDRAEMIAIPLAPVAALAAIAAGLSALAEIARALAPLDGRQDGAPDSPPDNPPDGASGAAPGGARP